MFNSLVNNPANLRDLTIHAGTNLLSESGVVYTASKAIVHENFSPILLVNDVGLLILSTAVEFKPLVQSISIAHDDVAPAGSSCTLTGWGTTSVSSSNKTMYNKTFILFNKNKHTHEISFNTY